MDSSQAQGCQLSDFNWFDFVFTPSFDLPPHPKPNNRHARQKNSLFRYEKPVYLVLLATLRRNQAEVKKKMN
jgi:hypothetical protein